MNYDIPVEYNSSEFIKVFTYEPIISSAYKQWFYSRQIDADSPLTVYLPLKDVVFTVEVVCSFISNRQTVDLIKVSTSKVDDTSSLFVSTSAGRSRNFDVANSSEIISFKKATAVDQLLTFTTSTGEFLYFDLQKLNAYNSEQNPG